jgi:glycosyltransferase involved in cell wall biosynthesis
MNRQLPGIIFLKSTQIIGGGEIQTINLAQELAKQGPILLVVNPDSPIEKIKPKDLDSEIVNLGSEADRKWPIIRLFFLKGKYQKKVNPLLINWYNKGYRTIVCQSINEKLVFSRIAKETGFRVIWLDFQLLLPWLPRNPLFPRLKEVSKYVDKILTTSQFLKAQHEKMGLGKVNVIVPGIVLPLDPIKKPLDKKNLVIGLVGRLHAEKGFSVFLESFKQLPGNVQAIIVGDGPAKNDLQNKIKLLNLEKRVTLKGFLANTSEIYKDFDIFCQPSLRDNTPLTVLEAMSRGLPVVASNIGAIPEIIGSAGLLVSPNQPELLAQELGRLVSDKDLRDKLSAQSFIQSKKFDIKQMANQFNDQISA